jgi:2-polyprenyl-3-methyl-5-hydroxy-6-metoxy-1,4-benzoquinol methylase
MASGYQTGAMINADLVVEENETARRAEAGHPQMDETFWDERYRSAPALWSGRPNATLVAEVTDLAPGRAIDVGAGEGADAIWLAEHGWTVTAQDISAVALERARQHADAAGPDVADRVTCLHGDLAEAVAQGASFDLVTSHYVHLPAADRMAMVRDLADLVAPGGHLLVVAHHPSDLATGIRRPRRPDVFFTAGEIAAELDERFTVLVTEARPREVDHDGKRITIRDTVLVAQRTR